MKTTELIAHTNLLTDEHFSQKDVLAFLNDGMARINAEVGAVFPNLTLENAEDEPVFPEKWQRMLLVTYAAARIKQNDGSQFEYNDLYSQFEANLNTFKTKYTVPLIYEDLDQGMESTPPDYLGNYYTWG